MPYPHYPNREYTIITVSYVTMKKSIHVYVVVSSLGWRTSLREYAYALSPWDLSLGGDASRSLGWGACVSFKEGMCLLGKGNVCLLQGDHRSCKHIPQEETPKCHPLHKPPPSSTLIVQGEDLTSKRVWFSLVTWKESKHLLGKPLPKERERRAYMYAYSPWQ